MTENNIENNIEIEIVKNDKKYLTTQQLAERWHIMKFEVEAMITQGKLPAFKPMIHLPQLISLNDVVIYEQVKKNLSILNISGSKIREVSHKIKELRQ